MRTNTYFVLHLAHSPALVIISCIDYLLANPTIYVGILNLDLLEFSKQILLSPN